MKPTLLKIAGIVGIIAATSALAQAQVKMGDNLGNHTATKTLNMGGFDVWNTTGISIGASGTYTALSGSIGLTITDGTKALAVSTVVSTAAIVSPVNGMIVYSTADNMLMVYSNSAWLGFLSSGLTAGAPTAATANGITITPVTTTTNGVTSTTSTVTLAPASLLTPGIVTFDAAIQTFGGPKTFAGNVVVGSATTTATSTLNGALTVGSVATPSTSTLNGALTVGNTTNSAASTLNGTLTVGTTAAAAATALNGALTVGNTTNSAASTLNGTLTVGTIAAPAATALNGALTVGNGTNTALSTFNGAATVNGKTILTGNSGTIAVPVNGVFMTPMIAAANTGESTLVIDNTSGEVRKSASPPVSSFHISVPIPTVTIANNTAVQISLTGILPLTNAGIVADDGIAVNYLAAEVAATPDLAYIAILSSVATGAGAVLVTVADMRDPSTVGLISAGTLLSGKHFNITRYAK